MSGALSKRKAALAAEEGKLKKLLKLIKKIMAKEFLWVLFILLMSIPLSLILEHLISTYASCDIIEYVYDVLEGDYLLESSYIVSVAGFYFSRTLIGAIKTLTEKT